MMSQQGQNLLKFLKEDQTRRQFCDVMVSVGGTLYSAHKVVLAHGSSYFHAELSKNPTAAQVSLDHVEDSVFQQLLELLYTSQCFIMEKDLPALIRAARFLDMMDVVKLLCGASDPVRVIQEEGGIGGGEVAKTCESTDTHSPDSRCSTGSGQVNASNSPRAEDHADVHQETMEEMTTATRRSARRRTPANYQRGTVGCPKSAPEKRGSAAATPEQQVVAVAAQEPAVADEDEGGVNEEDACMAGRPEGQPHSDEMEADPQTVPEVETRAAATGSSTQSPVYPEGLAPVIVQTSNKKTLKCPKCDKSFDRAGGAVPSADRFSLCWFLKEKFSLFFLFSI